MPKASKDRCASQALHLLSVSSGVVVGNEALSMIFSGLSFAMATT